MTTAPKPRYRKGDKFTMTEPALENYGEQHRGKAYTVAQWFDHYVKPEDMANDTHGHPGFDASAGSCIYDIEELGFSLYEWEMSGV